MHPFWTCLTVAVFENQQEPACYIISIHFMCSTGATLLCLEFFCRLHIVHVSGGHARLHDILFVTTLLVMNNNVSLCVNI